VLRRALLAASASSRLRRLITTAPQARAIVDSYVAGETADDAVRVTRALRARGCSSAWTTWARTPRTRLRPRPSPTSTSSCSASSARRTDSRRAAEVSVKPTAVGLFSHQDGEGEHRQDLRGGQGRGHHGDPRRRGVRGDRADAADRDPAPGGVRRSRLCHPGLPAAQRGGLPLAGGYGQRVRLCKGAYRELDSVAYSSRRDVDMSYARCLRALMNGSGYPMVATHDRG